MFLGSMIFVAISVWILVDESIQTRGSSSFALSIAESHGSDGATIYKIFGIICILFFGACAILFLHTLVVPEPPLVRVTKEGVECGSKGLIPWSEIKGFSISGSQTDRKASGIETVARWVNKGNYLLVDLIDPEKVIARFPELQQIEMRTSYKHVGSPVSVCLATAIIKEKPYELISKLNHALTYYIRQT